MATFDPNTQMKDPVTGQVFNKPVAPTSVINQGTGKTNAQVLAESTAAAQQAAQMAGLSFTPGAVINSGVMTPTPAIPYSSPNPTPPPPITPVQPDPYALSPIETDIQKELKRISTNSESMAGKAQYQADQNTAAGVDTLSKQQADLADQINALNVENQALPLQVQADYQGRATAGTIGGKVSEAQRDNTIKALMLQAQLAGTQNKLSYAQSLANKAVSLKYDPIQEQIDIATKNLELLSKDPSLSIAEKKRADSQLAVQQDKQNALNEDKTALTNILQLANNLVANGFTDPVVLSQIQNAKDASGRPSLAVAQQIAAQTGFFVPKLTGGSEVITGTPTPEEVSNNLPEGTPTETQNKQSILSILQTNKVSAGAKTRISDALNVMNAVQDLATTRQTEGFAGISPLNALLDVKIPFTDIGLVPFREALRSNAGRENAGYIEAINLKVQQWASGAALTAQQTAQVNRFTPTTSDTDEAVRTKLNNLYNFMLTQVQGNLQSEGIDFTPQKADLFEIFNLIKKASPEQLKELKNAGLIK